MHSTQESVLALAAKLHDEVEAGLLLSKITLSSEESDILFEFLLGLIDKKAGYPDYKTHM